MLTISSSIFDQMVGYCRAGLPNEVCGMLAGSDSNVSKLYTMTNTEPSPVSYFMEPSEQFKAIKDIRNNGLSMLAIFHSHPASEAFPSAKDVSLAFYDDAVYVIVSLLREAPAVKAFSIKDGKVKEIELDIR
ncbi:MAG: M67 family metallopeptidase [Nitrospirae bacterium]|nr:M67 family metallopeptidase [Nitrospirota bacterium]